MGQLFEGIWRSEDAIPTGRGGRFARASSSFRSWITADGSAGPTGDGGFRAEPGRYHLYVSLACPWAHRTLIMRRLKGLEKMITLSVVHWLMRENGWTFLDGPGVVPDLVDPDTRFLHQVYTRADPSFTGRVTVPVLWDRQTGTIVNNESSEILRMLNSAFDGVGAEEGDFYPAALRHEIDAVNDRVYETVNNGVYRAGFARSQDAYEEAARALFDSLDWLEQRLSEGAFLVGGRLTEADIRLFTTLIRFDAVYVGHFKCNLRRLADYPALSAFVERMLDQPGVAGTVDLEHIRRHYYESHRHLNPAGIVPIGPDLPFAAKLAG